MPISKNELKTSFTGTRKISKKNSKKNSKKTSKKNKSKMNTSTEEMMDILNSDNNHTNLMQNPQMQQMQNPQMQQQMQQQMQMHQTYNENVDPLLVNQFVNTNEQGQIINSNNRFEQLLGLAQLNPNYNNNKINNNLSTEMSMQSLNPMGIQLANQLNMPQQMGLPQQQMGFPQQHMGMENQDNFQLDNIKNLAALQNIPRLV